MSNNLKPKGNINALPVKIFSDRKSLITELLEVKHFRIIKHVFFVLLFGFIARDLMRAITNVADANFGLSIIKHGFRNFHLAVILWILLFMFNLLTHTLFKHWAENRQKFVPKSLVTKLWDTLFITVIVVYDITSLYAVGQLSANYLNLGIASSFAIIMENVRLLMKSHAFIRSNAPDVLNWKPHSDYNLELPAFSNYLYFSFAPTLLYRKEYPRTEMVNVKNAIMYFSEVLLSIWFQSYIFELFFIKEFQEIGKSETNWRNVAVIIVENALAGGVILLVNFYILLHAWQNAFAELLRFADKRFYEDWWASTNFSKYFRSWNFIVHDWLYEYIYSDFYYHIVPNNKTVAKVIVFLTSAIIHEYIAIFATRQFLPINFILFFSCGMTLTFVKTEHPIFNMLMLYGLALGNNIQISLHTIEHYARTNCPYRNNESAQSFVPRFVSMDCA